MRNFYLFLSFMITTIITFGQNTLIDYIYLKNGNIIKGTIIEQVPNKSYKIKTLDSNVFTFSIDEIGKISKEEIAGTNKNLHDPYKIKYQNITDFGLQFGIGKIQANIINGLSLENNAIDLSISTINGVLINSNVFVGIGIGFEKENSASTQIKSRFPIYFDTRFYITKTKVSPIIYTDMGYAFAWSTQDKGSDWGGILLDVGLGSQYRLINSTAIFLSIGYKLQQMKVYWSYNEYDKPFANFIFIKTGITF